MEAERAGGRKMGEAKIESMDADTFLLWCTRQEERYELVDGVPRPKAMVGARKQHDRVVRRALSVLERSLDGSPCEPFTEALAVRVSASRVLRPDVVVDCGDDDPDLLHADRPVVVIEVLSPSTRARDVGRKVFDYQTVPSIAHILLVEPADVAASLYSRESDGGWTLRDLIGRDTEVPLTAIGITLKLSDLYE